MGFYVNPRGQSKEDWLAEFGTPIPNDLDAIAKVMTSYPEHLPVCLVNNGPFTAAGVAFDMDEAKAFMTPGDRRQKRWYIAPKAQLINVVVDLKAYLAKQEDKDA